MKDEQKTKTQLVDELNYLRQQNSLLKKSNTDTNNKKWLSNNSDKLNRAIIDNSPLGISVRSSKGKLLSVNNAWKKIWNFTDEQVNEFMKENPADPSFLNTKESLGEWLPKVENIYKNGGFLHIPKHYLSDKLCDRSCWVSLTYYAINNEKNEVDRIVILTDDITNRVNLEKSTLESQSKYRSVIDNANIGISVIQYNKLVFCNTKIHEIFGYTLEEYSKIDFLSLVHPDDRALTVERIKNRLSGLNKDVKPLEIRAFCRSGQLKWIETNSTLIQWENKPALQAFVSDITERKQAEEDLKRYKSIVSSSNDMLALLDKNYIYLAANEKYLDAFGLTRDEIIGTTVSEIFGYEFFESVIRPNADKCLQGQEVRYQDWFDFPNMGKRYLKIIYDPYHGPDNKIHGFVVNGRDITEQKLADEALKKSEYFLKESQKIANLGSYLLDIGTGNWSSSDILNDICGINHDYEKTIEQWTQLIHPDDRELMTEYFTNHVLANKQPFDKEYRIIRHNDHQERWVHGHGQLIFDDAGQPIKMLGTVQDVTERKRAEEELWENKEKYKLLIENLNSIIVNFSIDGTIIYCSPNVSELGGYDPEKEIGQHFTKYLADETDLLKLQEIFQRIVTTKKSETFEFLYRPQNKEPFFVEAKANPVFKPESENLESISCIVSDITNRKQTQEELKKSEAKHRSLFNLSGDAIMIFRDGKFINCNKAALKLFDCPSEEKYCKLHPADISPKLQPCGTDSLSLANKQIAKAFKNGGNRFEWMHQDLSGKTFPAEVMLSPISLDNKPVIQAMVRDITERKLAEEELRIAHNFNDSIIFSLPELFYIIDMEDYLFLRQNDNWQKVTGYSDKELKSMMALEFFSEGADKEKCAQRMQEVFENGYSTMENNLLLKNGKKIPYYFTGRRVIINDKTYLTGMGIDISERKKAEKEITKFKTISDTANYGTAIVDMTGNIIYINECFAEMHGLTIEETHGKNLSIFHSDKQIQDVNQVNKDLLKNGSYSATEVWHKKKDGSVFPTMMNATVITDENNKPLYIAASAVDITERKVAEKALWESQEHYKNFFDNALIGLFRARISDGTFIDINSRAAELLGLPAEEIIGKMRTADLYRNPDQRKEFAAMLKQNNELFGVEIDMILPDGREVIFSFSIKAYIEQDYLEGCVVDITKSKRAEDALRDSENKFRGFTENTPNITLTINRDGKILYMNHAPEGGDLKNVIGTNMYDRMGSKYHEIAKEQVRIVFEEGKSSQFEADGTGPNGTTSNYLSNIGPIFGTNGEVASAIISTQDITKRKLAEEELRKLAEIVKHSSELVNMADLNGNMIFINEAGGNMLGIDPNECQNVNIMQVIPEHWTELVQNELLPSLIDGGQWKGDLQYVNLKTGKLIDVHAMTFSINDPNTGKPQFLANVSLDITERKKAADALNTQKQRLDNIIRGTNVGTWEWNVQTGETTFNNRWAEMLGYTLEEIVPTSVKTWEEFTHPNDLKLVTKLLDKHFDKTLEYYECELRMRHKNGNWIWVLDRGKVSKWDEDGKPLLMFGTHQDITKRKQDSEELRNLAEVVKYSGELINLTDLDGNMIFLNKAGGKMLGIEPNNVQNMNIMHVIPKNWLSIVESKLLPALMDGQHWKGELQYHNVKTGKLTDVHTMAFTVNDPKTNQPKFLANVSMDITETKRLREQESRAQRLESAGRVAGQIAHDFNNLLAPLVAYPDFIKEALPDNLPVIKYINDMEKSANKIAEINQQLLTLSRRGHYNQEVLNLNEVIQFAIGELGILPQTIVIETDFTKNLMNIKGGSAQISRVLSNIIHNARDSMQDVGNIIIKTENYYADNLTINYGQIPKGEYIKVTISDIGCGIPEDVRLNIFDPFFTTKSSDKRRGSGLGLSVVDAVMKDHNGFVDLKSTIGEGTSFYLYFPITREVIDAPDEDEIVGGGESILVIDDDKAQREVAMMILGKLGYKATAVNSGEKAIEYIQNNPQELLLLDMIMPDGIDGTETFRQILDIYPNQKAIIVSGFAESSRVEESRKLGIELYIRKPLTMRLLASCIRKVLDKKEVSVVSY